MIVFYVRVSTEEQNEARQLTTAKEVKAEKIFIDKKSGKNSQREELKKMLDFIRDGDTVVCSDISRIARNTKDLLNIVETIQKKGADFISIKENIDTTTPQGKFMLTVFGAMAELERDSILQRQKEGIEEAKAAGKYKGRKQMNIDENLFKITCNRWIEGEITATKAMKILGMNATTFYRKAKERGLSKPHISK